MLTATRREPADAREEFLGDMYLRLERLEAEVGRLRESAGRPATESSDAGTDEGDGGTDTRPEIALGAPTPRVNPWPAPRRAPLTLPNDTPGLSPFDFAGEPDADLLRVAFDLNPDAVVAVDGLGRVRLWNRAAVTLFGWSADEAVGSPPPFLPADRTEEHASLVRYPRSVIAGQELVTVRHNRRGEPVAVRLNVCESRCGGVVFTLRPAALTADDALTPDPRPAMSPPAANPALCEADAAVMAGDTSAAALVTLGRATAGVAHDFNNLLTTVLGSAGLLRELCPGPDARALATDIVTAAELAGDLCRNLTAVTRLSLGTPHQTDATSHVRRYARLVSKLAGARVAVRFELADDLPPAQVPQAEFAQVLLNLAQNAAETLEPTGGTLTVTTTTETTPSGRHVVLTVRDNGPPIHGRPATRSLGLAIVADILAKHGGHLTFETDAVTGTSFRAAFRGA